MKENIADEVIKNYLNPFTQDRKTKIAILVGKYEAYRYSNKKMASKIKSKLKKLLEEQ
jgi:hypothetical protein